MALAVLIFSEGFVKKSLKSENETKMRREAGEAPTFNGVSVLQKFLFSHAVKLLSGCLSEKKT